MSGPLEPIDPNEQHPGTPTITPVGTQDRARRIAQRPMPLAGGAFAGAGIALAVFGVIIWAGDYAVSGSHNGPFGTASGDTRNWLGIVLSLAVVALGYLLAGVFGQGPLATAGVAASALSTPTALAFMTLSTSGRTPFNIDVVFLVSILVWLLSYAAMPGARGHSFYVGLSGIAGWVYLIIKIESDVFGLPSLAFQRAFAGPDSGLADPTRHLAEMCVVSLVLGAIYYLAAFGLDRSGRHGAATGLAVAGVPAVLGGVLLGAHSYHQVGVGIALLVIGAVLVIYGGRARRRFTTWFWGAAMAFGLILLVQKASPDNTAAAGIAFVVIGAALAVVGAAVSAALNEREYPGA